MIASAPAVEGLRRYLRAELPRLEGMVVLLTGRMAAMEQAVELLRRQGLEHQERVATLEAMVATQAQASRDWVRTSLRYLCTCLHTLTSQKFSDFFLSTLEGSLLHKWVGCPKSCEVAGGRRMWTGASGAGWGGSGPPPAAAVSPGERGRGVVDRVRASRCCCCDWRRARWEGGVMFPF